MKQIMISVFFSLFLNVYANDEVPLVQATLTVDEAVIYAKKILEKGGCINCKLVGISYEYINGEWIIYVARINGPLGSDFHFFMKDKDPSVYRIVGGA